MTTASIISGTKKDSPSVTVETETSGLSESFFDYFEWSKAALCAGVQVSMFFTASSGEMAKIICGRCPVKRQCLIWALMYKEQGIWGGTTDDERKRLLPKYDVEELKSQAIRFGVYYPKRSAQEIRESLLAG